MKKQVSPQLLRTIKIVSFVLALAALVMAVLTHFMPVLNITLEGVESDYTFSAAGGHDFLGWQVIYYWWGPSIYIGGVSAFNFNIWLALGILLPILALLICTPMLPRALYRKKAVIEFIAAATEVFCAAIFLNIDSLAATTVGNHLASYMKMAQEQGTYVITGWVYALAAVMLVTAVVKVVSGVLSLRNEKEAAAAQAAARAAELEEDEDEDEDE